MNIARLEHADIHWRSDGDGAGVPLIFANSLGTDLRIWDEVVHHLLSSGLRIIRFDKRGHGLSSCPAPPYTLDALTEDTVQLLDYLDVERCIFAGLSIGGMIGQQLAARHPERLEALILSNTAARMGEATMWRERISQITHHGLDAVADSILARWFSPAFLNSVEALGWRRMLIRTPKDGYTGCCAAIAGTDLTHETATLTLPVLGIAGLEDQASPPEIVHQTIDLVSNGRVVDFPGVGHLPCVEKPDLFAAAVKDFLKETGHVG